MWSDLLAALALLMVIEGLLPFINPAGLRRTLLEVAQLPDSVLRGVGLASLVLGALLLWWVRG
ncbi:hypothetical protein M911_03745 [Ectothiorhodospira haloalkaliphila]|jgi:uncharacterized protein YjeT (DUF2065 family)|uniref:DUF2065 domain-containing protein n=2 Tax=Ectothiorhodospira TaxID=1051 RepID=A0A1H7PVZ8_9GAMM|nr:MULTISPECIES: DUF2065 domain-containing protein [Ectothiorhodospira]AHK78441.1 hypothetical protein M911_03745 [Ectothiorhodospira haloalkaliphila]MCG5494508.1 DUF2065 domain-containing protein [Ectothiorhodospira variabilis]MCG5498317.1 DUF2065 domain-containing protein [Ectothiorhodospira variabilis]MCG5503121.1 DUF2065 domain-containing protein [Ectothiorhodospira variabilis]MCG5506120.1 DUF2065 domain-containing protein [Ectothiorhodospira variabilis]